MIEVAVTTVELDRAKVAIYAEANIPECWLVLAKEEAIEVHTVPRGGVYTQRRLHNAVSMDARKFSSPTRCRASGSRWTRCLQNDAALELPHHHAPDHQVVRGVDFPERRVVRLAAQMRRTGFVDRPLQARLAIYQGRRGRRPFQPGALFLAPGGCGWRWAASTISRC
ncbi:MAG: Uma2 family endonuclease [Gluconacetobacter diazotrophicus]|nr:Uma2 family endonuclease [Gluconacetobacter diazotrophicus]